MSIDRACILLYKEENSWQHRSCKGWYCRRVRNNVQSASLNNISMFVANDLSRASSSCSVPPCILLSSRSWASGRYFRISRHIRAAENGHDQQARLKRGYITFWCIDVHHVFVLALSINEQFGRNPLFDKSDNHEGYTHPWLMHHLLGEVLGLSHSIVVLSAAAIVDFNRASMGTVCIDAQPGFHVSTKVI